MDQKSRNWASQFQVHMHFSMKKKFSGEKTGKKIPTLRQKNDTDKSINHSRGYCASGQKLFLKVTISFVEDQHFCLTSERKLQKPNFEYLSFTNACKEM